MRYSGMSSIVIVVLYGESCVLVGSPSRKGSFQNLTAKSGSNRPWNCISYLSMELGRDKLSVLRRSMIGGRLTVLTSPSAA